MVSEHVRDVRIILTLETNKAASAAAGNEIRRVMDTARQQTTRLTRDTSLVTARAIEDTSRATKKATNEMTASSRVALGHMASVGTHFTRLISSSARLARGIGFIFISGKKDREAYMQSLVKIIGYTDALAGGVNMVANMTRMWTSYSRAVGGAAVAHTALNAASTAGIMSGAAPAGTAIGRGAVSARMGVALPAAAGAGVGSVALAAGGAGLSGLAAGSVAGQTWSDFREYGFMGGATPGTLAYGIAEKEAGLFEWASSMFAGKQGLFNKLPTATKMAAGIPGLALRFMDPDPYGTQAVQRDREAMLRRRNEEKFRFGKETNISRLFGAQLAGQDRPTTLGGVQPWLENIKQQRLGNIAPDMMTPLREAQQIVSKIAAEQTKAARETVGAAKTRLGLLSQELAKVKEIQKQGQSAIERLVQAGPMGRAQLAGAKERLKAGQPSARDLETLGAMRGLGIPWLDEGVQAAYRKKFMESPGMQGFVGPDFLRQGREAGQQERVIRVQVAGNEQTIKITYKSQNEFLAKVAKIVRDIVKEGEKVTAENIEKRLEQEREDLAVGNEAIGG